VYLYQGDRVKGGIPFAKDSLHDDVKHSIESNEHHIMSLTHVCIRGVPEFGSVEDILDVNHAKYCVCSHMDIQFQLSFECF